MEKSLFALPGSEELGAAVAHQLGLSLAEHEELVFEDGEHKVRAVDEVRGRDVYVLSSLYGAPPQTVNDKLCRLLFFVGSLKDAWAGRVTALLPYLCYSRKDRRTKPRDPITTRYLARLLEAVGTDRVVTMDVHNLAAFENAHCCPTLHLEATPVFLGHFEPLLRGRSVVVVSPDSGGVKRADAFRTALQERWKRPVAKAFVEKLRCENEVWGHTLVGEVEGCAAIIFDDLISSGTTMAKAAQACRENGAVEVYLAATHGVFADGADSLLGEEAVTQIAITDSVPPFRITSPAAKKKLVVLSTAALWAEVVREPG